MRKSTLLAATAIGVILGATLFAPRQGAAQRAVIDWELIATVASFASSTLTALSTLNAELNSILTRGFQQLTNYQKASVGALQQITDASNTVMARFHRDVRNAQIRDEHVPNPNLCNTLDGGVATVAAGVAGYGVVTSIAATMDQRGNARPGMPSHRGEAQGAAASAGLHLQSYCNEMDVEAGLCSTLSPRPDANQSALSLWSGGTYQDQAAINTAKDYMNLLIQPVAPAALRGDQLASTQGQVAAVERRSYNARISLANHYTARVIGMQTASVVLSPEQRRVMTAMGLPEREDASWLNVLRIEAERRISDVSWAGHLAAAPQTTVLREIAQQQAQTNFLLFHIFQNGLMRGQLQAAELAAETERTFERTSEVSTPNVN